MTSAALHKPQTIASARHVPSWLLLTFAAGSVNATAFLACQRFVTHVTGIATRLAMDAGEWFLLAEYGIVLACFVLGSLASVFAIDGRYHRGKEPLYALPLVVVSASLVGITVAGEHGAFGPFGGSVESAGDFLLLSLLAFAMGLQNATVASTTGMAIRTTHLTGTATDLGIHLGTAVFAEGEARSAALRTAALRGGKIVAFILGGAVAVGLPKTAGFLLFLVPAVAVTAGAALSFVPSWSALEIPRVVRSGVRSPS